ncbi:hypothetical protein ACIBAG_31940 [Streptomyces sp. NPDC051243]|uniref:hypothetical protein n=1 Tax=Streptomyces sp. NPDC051243 TaxID=3365646 RepID=UPI0037A9B140
MPWARGVAQRPFNCLFETEEDADGGKWTMLVAPEARTYRPAAPYQLRRGTECPDELKQP